jgi:hypothetical protein
MIKRKSIFICLFASFSLFGQKEVTSNAEMKKVTVFFTGAQIQHEAKLELKPGKQEIVFQKLTDFLDPNTVQVKAQGELTILSVRTRKNYEDLKISSEDMQKLNVKRKTLAAKDKALRDEYTILELDKNLLMRNRDLKGNSDGLKVLELKEAYLFMHQKLTEITNRQSAIRTELEDLDKNMNQLEQEIISQRSKPVINYSEIIVEVDVERNTNASFVFNYISPRATWKPYYDMRSDGIGKPVRLEAKANVSQTTGIEWKNVDLVLSTNDPYQNAQEPNLNPWYIYYNNYPQQKTQTSRPIPVSDYSGEKLRGEVIDASTGEPLPFTKVAFYNNPNVSTVTDFEGKFEITIPKGETYLKASFVGYTEEFLNITSAYLKFFLVPNEVEIELTVEESFGNGGVGYAYGEGNVNGNSGYIEGSGNGRAQYNILQEGVIEGVKIQDEKSSGKNSRMRMVESQLSSKVVLGNRSENSPTVTTIVQKKDLRVEYTIASKMTIPTDGMDHRVSISTYDLNASYEYHVIPKVDPSVYLAAQVTGWEKLNLMSGESNIYFDGTFMGKSYLDVNSTKDTLSFSFGKDNKISVDRTRIKEKSKSSNLGKRQKFEVNWEIKIKNNGAAQIPLIVKDQFPISNNDDIKVKQGNFGNGKLDEKTSIITWSFLNGITGTQSLLFDYSVDYQSGAILYLE